MHAVVLHTNDKATLLFCYSCYYTLTLLPSHRLYPSMFVIIIACTLASALCCCGSGNARHLIIITLALTTSSLPPLQTPSLALLLSSSYSGDGDGWSSAWSGGQWCWCSSLSLVGWQVAACHLLRHPRMHYPTGSHGIRMQSVVS